MVSKKEIERIRKESLDMKTETAELASLLKDLKMKFDSNESLSICEEQLICSALHSRPDLHLIDYYNDHRCATYWFNLIYLLYCNNLNGHGPIYNRMIPGAPLMPRSEVEKDILYLNREFARITSLIEARQTPDDMLTNYKSEAKHQLNELNKYCTRVYGLTGHFKKEYLKKFVTLHSWFLFLKVKEYFQELGRDEIIIPSHYGDIVIDSYIYIHVLFRHFAETVTNYQIDKSYHSDQANVSHEWLPDQIKGHIEEYLKNIPNGSFNGRFISMRMNGIYYEIWFRKMSKSIKGGSRIFLRVQSFYPINRLKDLQRIQLLQEIRISDLISFYI